MDISELAVRLVVMLFPGIVAALVVDKLTVHKPWDTFRFGLYALLMGGACYLIMQAVIISLPCLFGSRWTLKFWSAISDRASALDFGEILAATSVAVFLGIFVSLVVNRKWVHRSAQWFRITEKYGDESLFYFFLNSPSITWVRIRLEEEGLMYEGYRESFSDADGCQEILLREVHVYRLSDSSKLYELDSAFLRSSSERLVIESPRS